MSDLIPLTFEQMCAKFNNDMEQASTANASIVDDTCSVRIVYERGAQVFVNVTPSAILRTYFSRHYPDLPPRRYICEARTGAAEGSE